MVNLGNLEVSFVSRRQAMRMLLLCVFEKYVNCVLELPTPFMFSWSMLIKFLEV